MYRIVKVYTSCASYEWDLILLCVSLKETKSWAENRNLGIFCRNIILICPYYITTTVIRLLPWTNSSKKQENRNISVMSLFENPIVKKFSQSELAYNETKISPFRHVF